MRDNSTPGRWVSWARSCHRWPVPLIVLFFLWACHVSFAAAAGESGPAGKKVLVVASYHQEYKWVADIVQALQRDLAGAALTFFYMDTKKNPQGAEAKAREALNLYRRLQPDAVITMDDAAQEYLVVPHLKDQVATPVIFCAVNDDACKYGFPASNVTGVVEKKHYRESISFAQVINPAVRRVAVLYSPSDSNTVNLAQIDREKETYTAEIVPPVQVRTIGELERAVADLATRADALLLLNMTGIRDEQGRQLEGHDSIRAVVDRTGLVTIGASDWEIESGALCGVIKAGEEQGALAAEMLLSLWGGKKISELPLTWNKYGQRYLNIATLKKLNLQLNPAMIIGTRIIAGQEQP